jgi:hypothetical protein
MPAWATAISPGPADESGQVVTFTAVAADPSLFTAGGTPAVSTAGALTFTPRAGAHGTTTVTVRAVDDGGTANGGVDTSAAQVFTFTIANRAPATLADAPVVDENDPAGVTFDVLANDTDPDGDALSVASYDDSSIANGGLTDNGGGSFTYVPAPHFAGADTFAYTVDDGNGGTATGTVTITVNAVPDPPAAADDAYVTAQGVALVQAAPGVLVNDADGGGGALIVDTTPVAGPANGSLALAADGSFTYAPVPGFTGDDSFTYRVTSVDTGLSSTAVATVTVSPTHSSQTLYFGTSGISSEVWNLTTAAPGASLLVPDYDGDLLPGLTIKSSDGKDKGEARKSQTWRWPLAAPLVLNGPVTVHLSSSDANSKGTAYAYLYDCTAGGATCTQVGYGSVSANPWNLGILAGLLFWGHHDVSLGAVSRTLPAGHELRVRLYVGDGDQNVAMTAALPTSLELTVP